MWILVLGTVFIPPPPSFSFSFIFEMGWGGSHYVVQADFKLEIFPLKRSACWDYSCVFPCLATILQLTASPLS